MKKIEFYKHNLGREDIKCATKVMRSLFLTTGPMVSAFEAKFADYLDIREAVAVTSCTAAIHLVLLRYGIGPGDEVITTPMTFVATATAVLETGAIPIFADVSPVTGLLLPESVEKAISPKTKAIIVVHLYGRMADMKRFESLANKHNLVLIEDSAHCIEGKRDGVRPGALGHAACFSFYATKNITCGEGGAIACKSHDDAEWYRSMRHHGISKNASFRYTKIFEHYDMDMMGWKYNMDDIHAALLIKQLERINKYHKIRKHLEFYYRELLNNVDGLGFMELSGPDEISGHHLFTVLMPEDISRDAVVTRLQDAGIGCAVNYRSIHNLSYFREKYNFKPDDFPNSNKIGNCTISLPLYPKLARPQIKSVCEKLIEIINDLREKK